MCLCVCLAVYVCVCAAVAGERCKCEGVGDEREEKWGRWGDCGGEESAQSGVLIH